MLAKLSLVVADYDNIIEISKHAVKIPQISESDSFSLLQKIKPEVKENAEHVGIVRATQGNLPAILARISSHKKALGAVLNTGVPRGHRGNPAASLCVVKV